MKKFITSLFVLACLSSLAQEKTTTPPNSQPAQRVASNSIKAKATAPAQLPYDVNDKYMGRKLEFLNQMTVKELPADFPEYKKEYGWGVAEYNAVVQAYYMNHKDILSEQVLNKINYQVTH